MHKLVKVMSLKLVKLWYIILAKIKQNNICLRIYKCIVLILFENHRLI